MIFVTGDTHAGVDIEKLNSKSFPYNKSMTKEDYVVVAGDFGFIWDESNEEKYWHKWFQKKNFTTLFIDGNHENFDLLNKYPAQVWNGGKVHLINDSIIHLMRGQVYTIQGTKLFTFGGSKSTDIEFRTPHKSWWPEEMPSAAEYEEGIKNLSLNNWEVDYVITHTCPTSTLAELDRSFGYTTIPNEINHYLEELDRKVQYKKWFFGHYHCDVPIRSNATAIFNQVELLE